MDHLLARIDLKRRQLFRQGPLPAVAIARIKDAHDLAWIHSSHAWGGGTLRRHEVASVVQTGLAIAERPVSEHLEVLNLAEAIDWIEDWARTNTPLRPRDIRQIHAIVQHGLPAASPGRFRSGDVYLAGHTVPPARGEAIPGLVQALCTWINGRDSKRQHTVWRATQALSQLSTLLPFREGNDTVARIVMNGLLLQKAYPVAVLDDADGLREALWQAQAGTMAPLVTVIGSAVEHTLDRYLAAL